MASGLQRVKYFGSAGQAVPQGRLVNDWDFIYEASTQKNPQYNVGDRVVLPDGRVFRYAKSAGTVLSGFGAAMSIPVTISGSLPAQTGDGSFAIGSRAVTVTIAADDGAAGDGVIAKDELRGGYIVINNNTSNPINRGIVGNTAVASGGGTSVVYLDGPITTTLTTSSYCEIMPNPYLAMTPGGGGALEFETFLGVPAVGCTTGKYFWLQTWGPLWVTPGGATTPGDSANDRTVVFVGDGSLNGVAHVTLENGYQVAGVIMQRDSNGSGGPPFVMLQVSP